MAVATENGPKWNAERVMKYLIVGTVAVSALGLLLI
jgi:hypothetical protein